MPPNQKVSYQKPEIILKGYSTQKVGNFEGGKQVNGRSYRQASWNTMIDVYATESEHYNFSH